MKAFYCVGTHWDREWYEPFQEFRMWLVELIDELIELMEQRPEYPHFHLDGQAVTVEDYLQIRPEKRERLLKLLKEGRIVAGPWYDLPDEWLISGESYIRNLMRGLRTCRELGFNPMRYAYTPDQFGHIAALPMIMTGFGLEAGIVWRGTQDENYPAHFVWVGPDGSRMVTHKLMDKGSYGPFDFLARTPIEKADYSDESFQEHFETYWREETSRSPVPLVLMLDAIDHQAANPKMPRLFEELKRRYPEIEFQWGTLEQYGRELVQYRDQLPERRGELREPCRSAGRVGQYLIVHTISSRYPIKRSNDRCQAVMEKWVEPYTLFQKLNGGEPILRYVELAWEYLLKNHPHDSICGCSIDQVHRDMQYRFDQCEEIADGVVRRATASLAGASETAEALANVVVHHPLPFGRKAVVDVDVAFPADWTKRYIDGLATGEPLNKFRLVKADGEPVPFQMVSIDRNTTYKRLKANGRKHHAVDDVYCLAVELDLPACGYTSFKVEPTDEGTRNFGTLRHGPLGAGNGLISFNLSPDGTGEVVHEASGVAYGGLFLYEDSGDAGDGWTRGPLVDDRVIVSPGSRVTTSVEEDGPLRTVFRVEREFDLPKKLDRMGWRRSAEKDVVRVTDRISVEKGAPYLRVRTTVENTCESHRFRVLFPTEVDCEESFADTPFAMVRRPIAIPPETATWQERVNPETAFTSMFGVQGSVFGDDDVFGLAVLAPFGLHEYEVTQTEERSLALTLFRSTFQTVATAGEPDGLLLGTLEYEYLLYPFAGEFRPAEALRHVAAAQTGVRYHTAAELPAERSMLQVEAEGCVVSAVKPSAEGAGAVVRLWNPGETAAPAFIRFERKPVRAERCNLNEEAQGELPVQADGSVLVEVPAGGLSTVKLHWE